MEIQTEECDEWVINQSNKTSKSKYSATGFKFEKLISQFVRLKKMDWTVDRAYS